MPEFVLVAAPWCSSSASEHDFKAQDLEVWTLLVTSVIAVDCADFAAFPAVPRTNTMPSTTMPSKLFYPYIRALIG